MVGEPEAKKTKPNFRTGGNRKQRRRSRFKRILHRKQRRPSRTSTASKETKPISGVDKRVVSKRAGCGGSSPGTKTRTRVHSDVPTERKRERGYVRMFPREGKQERGHIRQNRPFTKLPFDLPMTTYRKQQRPTVSKKDLTVSKMTYPILNN